MDPFTQRMLEKAEQRSRALGISNASSYPLIEDNVMDNRVGVASGDANKVMGPHQQQPQPQHRLHTIGTNTSAGNRMEVVELPTKDVPSEHSPKKVLRQFTAVNKENMDLGIEINILTDKEIQLHLEVEENDITDNDADEGTTAHARSTECLKQPLAKLRDTSRNRLQRLGALYSNTDDLSSPIHRTEAQFHAGSAEDNELVGGSPKKMKKRLGKLVALANTINQWEDDTAHHAVTQTVAITDNIISAVPPPKPDLPSRPTASRKSPAPQPPKLLSVEQGADGTAIKTKQLKWDQKVINSLEAQGFQRRESSTVKHVYDYSRERVDAEQQCTTATVEKSPGTVSKLANNFDKALTEEVDAKNLEKKLTAMPVKSGLVSGRAAAFEHKTVTSQQPAQRPQKDPTELSLKERMNIFERNKGDVILPKAAFGMAPSISQIRQEISAAKKGDSKTTQSGSATTTATTSAAAAALVKPESKLLDKVAALFAGGSTTSENKIKSDMQKQWQEDLQVLTNRFNRQKELFGQEQGSSTPKEIQIQGHAKKPTTIIATSTTSSTTTTRPKPPPPPPPMPTASPLTSKRRSPGNAIDDESKRARTSNTINRLYPDIAELELESSNASHTDDNCCATVTATASDGQIDDEQESYMDSSEVNEEQAEDSTIDICNGSLGREIMQTVQKNEAQLQEQRQRQQHQKKEVRYAVENNYFYNDSADFEPDSSINSSAASMGIDDYLDEALDDNTGGYEEDGEDDYTHDESEVENTNGIRLARSSKGTTASNSFSFRKMTPNTYVTCQTINEDSVTDFQTPDATQPVRSELSVNENNDNLVTLVHTVSFYRRQQNANSANSTPVHKINRDQQLLLNNGCGAKAKLVYDSPPTKQLHHEEALSAEQSTEDESANQSDCDNDSKEMVQEKMKKLLDEVCKQQQIIGQTSQALNLCAATVEFSGSTESVEGERHLLVATHRRQACLDEVQRLRVENTLRPSGAAKEKGRLTVKEITIPLRQDYIRKLAADTISGHHLVCLLKYNELVLATKTVPTLPGLLAVKFPDVLQLNNVYADFRITLEIYGMTAQREVLPHEVKYHINLNKKSGIKTPKKKGAENRLVMPPVESPAGPNAVRTPALVQYGFAIFSLREVQRTTWTLTQVLGVSPLDGVVHMKMNCELCVTVEYKGFLTMFEDISGFGAWHRRWCYLNGAVINYWKYPDDEKKKAPMGSIDLLTTCSTKIAQCPRDICARLNTFLLECERPAKDTDQESLIIVPNGRMTIVRHLLSADTKEERDEWCAFLNKALLLLRAWGPAV